MFKKRLIYANLCGKGKNPRVWINNRDMVLRSEIILAGGMICSLLRVIVGVWRERETRIYKPRGEAVYKGD